MIHNKRKHHHRHSRESGNPAIQKCFGFTHWTLAFAGMTKSFITMYMLAPLVLANSAQADGLGRLFFTPEQRAQLEHERILDASAAGGSPPSELTLNGIVQKKGGARTVWINGVAQDSGNGDGSPDALPVSVPGKSLPVKVKVGQKLLLNIVTPQRSHVSVE